MLIWALIPSRHGLTALGMNVILCVRLFNMDNKKLLELTLHIAHKAGTDGYLGKTKLNKILFLIDFHYYFHKGKSITGQKYIHLPYGPVPKNMDKIHKMKDDIVFQETSIAGYKQHKSIPLRDADVSMFSQEELKFIDEVIDILCHKRKIPAKTLSDDSHDYLGYAMTENGQEIPYNTIFLEKTSKQKVTPAEKIHAFKLRKELGESYGFEQ